MLRIKATLFFQGLCIASVFWLLDKAWDVLCRAPGCLQFSLTPGLATLLVGLLIYVSSANVVLADTEVVKIQEVFAQEEEGRSNSGYISKMQRR